MDNIFEAAATLNKLLLESDEYNAYLSARAELKKSPQYLEMADKFRKKQVDHEIQKTNGESPEIDEMALANEYADICLIPACNDFFQAEMRLLKLVETVYSDICRGLLIDM